LSSSGKGKSSASRKSNIFALKQEKFWLRRAMSSVLILPSPSVEIYMDSFMIYSNFSRMVVIFQEYVISFLVISWTVALIVYRHFCFCWPTRYATQIWLLSSEVTTNAVKLLKFTGSTINAFANTVHSMSGGTALTSLTTFLWQLLSTIQSSVFTAALVLVSMTQLMKYFYHDADQIN